MIWAILLAIAVVVLLIFWRKRSAVWGTATFAALIGVGIAALQSGFDWWIVGKALVIGTFIGLVFEALSLATRLWSAQRPYRVESDGLNSDGGGGDQVGFGRDFFRRTPSARHQVCNDLPRRTHRMSEEEKNWREIKRLLGFLD